ncbi:MAG: hypothetical protein ACLQUT_06255 [Thermoleophilia bacterium]
MRGHFTKRGNPGSYEYIVAVGLAVAQHYRHASGRGDLFVIGGEVALQGRPHLLSGLGASLGELWPGHDCRNAQRHDCLMGVLHLVETAEAQLSAGLGGNLDLSTNLW